MDGIDDLRPEPMADRLQLTSGTDGVRWDLTAGTNSGRLGLTIERLEPVIGTYDWDQRWGLTTVIFDCD